MNASEFVALAWPFVILVIVIAAVVFYRKEIGNILANIKWLKATPTSLEFKVNQTRKNVEDAVAKKDEIPGPNVEEVPGDFDKIKPYFDWQKFHKEVGVWASRNKAKDPWDMGPKNFLRCLFDLGIPGGKRFELEREEDGSLRYQ